MVRELRRTRYMAQDVVAWQIERRFGRRFIYINPNGNPAIEREVLREFERRTGEGIVWERGQRLWRYRERSDLPGRQQP